MPTYYGIGTPPDKAAMGRADTGGLFGSRPDLSFGERVKKTFEIYSLMWRMASPRGKLTLACAAAVPVVVIGGAGYYVYKHYK